MCKINVEKINLAYENISEVVRHTPLLSSKQLSIKCENDVYLKSEHLQMTGSFKIRGAYNMVKEAVKNGAQYITTASSGNHGQAVAYAASLFKVRAVIVVPRTVAMCKQEAIRSYQGEVVVCGTTSEERILKAKMLAAEHDGIFIPPYDDPLIIAGQGTVGLEIIEDLADVDAIIVPIGGGGLVSGVLLAIKENYPHVKIIGVEPELAQDTYLSLKENVRIGIETSDTIADGLRTTIPGALTFPILQKYLDEIVLVTENEIRMAFTFVLERMKQMIEPSSATTIAALMFGKIKLKNKKIVCIISGGNVDVNKISQLLK